MEMFEEAGAEISVTELDVTVNGASAEGLTEQQEIAQARVYAELFQIYRKHADSIARVTFWGIDDAHSWRRESFPCLFRRDYSPKQAYYAVIDPMVIWKNIRGMKFLSQIKFLQLMALRRLTV